MNKTILDIIAKIPDVYETTGEAFWDEEHISKSMLEAHLDIVGEGASRNSAFMERSAQWIRSLVDKKDAALLDLGCGPGLYGALFETLGFRVTGMDFSKRSIAYAKKAVKEAGLGAQYIYQDYLTMEYEEAFEIATLIYCDFPVLPFEAQKTLASKVYAALKPGGKFVLDVFTPNRYTAFQEGTTVEYTDGGFWSPERYMCITRSLAYPNDSVYLNQHIVVTDAEVKYYNVWDHAFSLEELQGLMMDVGFCDFSVFGDVAGKAYSVEGETLCLVCGK